MATLGAMRHRITLQRPDQGRDDIGTPRTTFTNVATVWAAYKVKIAAPKNVAERAEAVVTYDFEIHFQSDVAKDWRILLGDKVLTVTAAVDLTGERKFLTIQAEDRS